MSESPEPHRDIVEVSMAPEERTHIGSFCVTVFIASLNRGFCITYMTSALRLPTVKWTLLHVVFSLSPMMNLRQE